MKITILVDNTPACGCPGEWGLSAYIEHGKEKILLDTGASSLYAENAERLGIKLSSVRYAVLSHAHYDHAGGMPEFFAINKKAKFYLAGGAGENCYRMIRVRHRYIGIPRGVLAENADRIVYCSGITKLCDGAWLVPHSTEGLEKTGIKNRMDLKEGRRYRPDDFSHEQTLILESGKGLVILNSCSHSGPDVIIREVQKAFPGKLICAYIGGLHLYERNEQEIAEISNIFRYSGITAVYTGHCTGDNAFRLLQQALGTTVLHLETGLKIEL